MGAPRGLRLLMSVVLLPCLKLLAGHIGLIEGFVCSHILDHTWSVESDCLLFGRGLLQTQTVRLFAVNLCEFRTICQVILVEENGFDMHGKFACERDIPRVPRNVKR